MKSHDKIAIRLSLILTKLNTGEKLNVEDLAKEFNVTPRTIQRDLNERFKNVPLKKVNKHYFLESHNLGKVTFQDINKFASFSGINKMFPSFKNDFLQHLLDKEVANAYLIKTHNFEDVSHKIDDFNQIEKAIIEKRLISLVYREQERTVQPYKFANVKGIWYLVALQNKIIKTFTFTKITDLKVSNSFFSVDTEILKKIEKEDTLWFSNTKIEVLLNVNANIASYFKRRAIFPYQNIEEELKDGTLLVSTQMTFENEILQMVQFWLPNIDILSPISLKEKLKENLLTFLN